MSEFLLGNGHPLVKSNTPLQVEVNVPQMRPCKLRATFFIQENFATPEAEAKLRAWDLAVDHKGQLLSLL